VNDDFLDLLTALVGASARFLVVGAHALAVHGATRATEDLDVFIDRSASNAARVWQALTDFGAPLKTIGVTLDDFARADQVVQIGVPPRRIDIMTGISGVTFDEAWSSRVITEIGGVAVPFLGRDLLIQNKRASGRPKDLHDIETIIRGSR